MPKWTCPECHRQFAKKGQQHSCATKPLKDHFTNKLEAYKLFQLLLKKIELQIGKIKILSIPCCIHLYGSYDFMAILPKMKGVLELRFALDHTLKNKRIFASVPISSTSHKNCLRITSAIDIDAELLGWLKQSYSMHVKE
ncbi:MAG: DUF5655 domain-containing protein [Patescibacteria group bacterium]|jgi:hypothetical protein